jgi:hypothetical protein
VKFRVTEGGAVALVQGKNLVEGEKYRAAEAQNDVKVLASRK